MQDSRLFSLLSILSKSERRELRKFVASPFFNQRQDVLDLLDFIAEQELLHNQAPDKREIFVKLYGNAQPFDDHRVRMAMSFLTRLVEQFLAQKAVFQDDIKSKTKLAEALLQRNQSKHFERLARETAAALENSPWRNADFLADQFQIQLLEYRHDAALRRPAGQDLQALADQSDLVFFAQKLRLTCTWLAHQAVFKTELQFGLLDEILAHVQAKGWLEKPAIAVYFHCYHALTQPHEPQHFLLFKKCLTEQDHLFPPAEITDLYLLAINFCIKRYNEGSHEYLRDELDLYQEGLQKGYFLQNGSLGRFTFRNIVTVGLVMREFEWVENFIRTFSERLEAQFRESMVSFNLARLEFERRNFPAALQLLQKSEYEDLLLNLAAKSVMLKIFYELDEFDALASHLEAMRMFIRRQKNKVYQSENYLNTIAFTKKLMEIKVADKAGMTALRQEIGEAKNVAERQWLLNQMAKWLNG